MKRSALNKYYMRAKRACINASSDELPSKGFSQIDNNAQVVNETPSTSSDFFSHCSDNESENELFPNISDIEYPSDLESGNSSDLKIQENSTTNCDSNNLFKKNLANWAITHNISHSALNDLLNILRPLSENLPVDARTLLQTARTVNLKPVTPGQYFHFGLNNCIKNILDRLDTKSISIINNLAVQINVDGLPLCKSSSSQVYPILANIVGFQELVEMIGIYHGNEKPQNANEFLNDFVKEAIELVRNGFSYSSQHFSVEIKAFICDAPAKSFIKFVKGHSGYFSCTKCYTEGEYSNRIYFPDIHNLRLRTDGEFRDKVQKDHHTGVSVIELIPKVDMIKSFPLDYMHLVCLGVTKKLLYLWCYGKPSTKISFSKVSAISDILIRLSSKMPVEFNRKSRSLNDLKRWKATEFRHFLFYTGIIALKNNVSHNRYSHFLSLHAALTILSSSRHNCLLDYASELLEYFVKSFKTLYGPENMSHNVHNLLHLTEDVRNHGPVHEFSAFPFENFLQSILKLIRKNDKPLQQIVKRYGERQINTEQKKNVLKQTPYFKNIHENGPLVHSIHFTEQYQAVVFPSFLLKNEPPNNCCCLKGGQIVLIFNFGINESGSYFLGKKYINKTSVYTSPCNSSDLDIFKVGTLSDIETFNIEDIAYKCIHLDLEDEYFVFPLMHCALSIV